MDGHFEFANSLANADGSRKPTLCFRLALLENS